MHLILTGLTGSLGPKVSAAATARGWVVTGWDRQRVPPAIPDACNRYLDEVSPGAIIHLAMGEESWAGLLAEHASNAEIPFVFTSSAMVFDHVPDGPHAPRDTRTAKDDYGRYKMRCEDAVLKANPSASVVRIGWQIDADAHGHAQGNNMLAHLDEQQHHDGRIVASSLWRPACSFMADTAEMLLGLVAAPVAGVLHADSNAVEGYTFEQIVRALKFDFARTDWVIVAEEGYRHDQRLVRGLTTPPLSVRLPALTRREMRGGAVQV